MFNRISYGKDPWAIRFKMIIDKNASSDIYSRTDGKLGVGGDPGTNQKKIRRDRFARVQADSGYRIRSLNFGNCGIQSNFNP